MSGEVKHTPGPWRYFHDECAECAKNGKAEYIIVGPPGASHGQFGNEDDARLISAAPDMLEALRAIVAMNVQYCLDRYGDASQADSMGCVVAARAAIAKAEGRS